MKGGLKLILKTLLVFAGFSVIFVVIAFCWMLWSMLRSSKAAEVDYELQMHICDSLEIIDGVDYISLSDFDQKDIDPVKFMLIRAGDILSDTMLFCHDTHIALPFHNFLRTDSVLMVTNGGNYYFITGFRYTPYLGYGMFGYVGFRECRLANEFILNGRQCATWWVDPGYGLPADSVEVKFRWDFMQE